MKYWNSQYKKKHWEVLKKIQWEESHAVQMSFETNGQPRTGKSLSTAGRFPVVWSYVDWGD